MSGNSEEEEKAPIILRNGLDYEKKVSPPDYSNVPSDRDWQMSPFSNERYDLDEIQKAEKKGYKFKAEVERLKKLYGGGSKEESSEKKEEKPDCEACFERQEKERQKTGHRKLYCTSDYLYQPYGPIIVSSVSYSRPDTLKPRMYSYLGPSIMSGFKNNSSEGPVPCEGIDVKPRRPDFGNVYIPYGPLGEIRLTQDQYVPMGPTNSPLS